MPTGEAGAGTLPAAEAAGPPEGVPVAAGWLGVLAAGAGALAAAAGTGAGLADGAGPVVPEVPAAPASVPLPGVHGGRTRRPATPPS